MAAGTRLIGAGALFAPGFFTSASVARALIAGGSVAVLCAVVGTLTVVRGQSFAGHALGDIGASGGAGAFLAGVSALWGFVAVTLAAAAAMELVGVQRARSREEATGVVLGAGFGLTALLLYETSIGATSGGATIQVLFGSLFAITPALIAPVLALAAASFVICAALARPLMLSAVSPELAAARGVAVRALGVLYLAALALAVAMAALTVGAILSTALLIGPAASAVLLARTPARAAALAGALALAATWGGVLMAYDSYGWPPYHHGWPVSFFVVAIVVVAHLGARALAARGGTR